MSERFGVHISRDRVRAVLVRRSSIAWHDEIPLAPTTAIGEAVALLLARAPKRSARGRIAGLALGTPSSQTKELVGVPPVPSEQILRRLVSENPNAFFIHTWSEIVVGTVERRADNTCWATAHHGALVREASMAVRTRFAKTVAVTSSLIAVARLLPAGEHRCTVDGIGYRITTIECGVVTGLARDVSASANPACDLAPALCELGERAWDFAPAYGAALLAHDRRLAWRGVERDTRARRVRRAAIAVAAFSASCAATWAYTAPGVRALWVMRDDASATAGAPDHEIEAARTASELQRSTSQLAEVERFQASRGAIPALIGDLTRSLPESTAVVNLRVDSVAGSVVIITPHVPDVLPQLVPLTTIVAPRLVGSITYELAANAQMERASIRFDRPHRDRAPVRDPSARAAP